MNLLIPKPHAYRVAPIRIEPIYGVVQRVHVKVQALVVPDGISLQEPSPRKVVRKSVSPSRTVG
jgi:hypothetical protein